MWGPLISGAVIVSGKFQEHRDARDLRDFEARVADPEMDRIFVSYCRSEAPLVVDMVEEFDKLGVATFVDFRNLEPGTPWDETLNEAVSEAETFVLVVSYRSVWDSEACATELAQAIAQNKRIVLAIAEPVALPESLRSREWVDIRRGGFKSAVADLGVCTQHPAPASEPAPTSGFRPPPIVWLAFALAIATALLSIPLVWTIVVPVLLLPLPVRIVMRDFPYQATRSALLGQAVALFVVYTDVLPPEGEVANDVVEGVLSLSVTLILVPLMLLAVLRSRRFRRWMSPQAARPMLPVLPNIADAAPTPQQYAVHHAPQDASYVEEFTKALDEQGHEQVTPGNDRAGSAVELRFVSKFNDTSDISDGPGVSWTLPIIISEPDDELPRHLTEAQWLDLRAGGRVRRARAVECFAAWFDRPKELLRPLGVPAPHGIPIFPRGVRALHDLLLTCIVALGLAVVVQVALAPVELSRIEWGAALGCSLGFVALAARTVDRLSNRRPTSFWLVYVPTLTVLLAVSVAALVGWESIEYIFSDDPEPQGPDLMGSSVAFMVLFLAWIGLPIGWLATRRETRMWIPSMPEGDPTRDRPVHDLRVAVGAARGAIRTTWNDTTGRTLRERRSLRHDVQSAATAQTTNRSAVS